MSNDDTSSMSLIERAAARQARERLEAAEAAEVDSVPNDAPVEASSELVPEDQMTLAGSTTPTAEESVDEHPQDNAAAGNAALSAVSANSASHGVGAVRKVSGDMRSKSLVSVQGANPQARVPADPTPKPPTFDINFQILETEGFLTPGEGRSQLAQEFRRIKRPLLLNMRRDAVPGVGPGIGNEQPSNLLMVSSALPNEGKTFVSINLAMSIAAEMNRKVLLVDADVAKGHVGRTLGFVPEYGLSEILKGDDISERGAIYETNVPGLSLLGTGVNDLHMDELFASERMGQLMRRLALEDPDRVVVFDAPPLLATTEAGVLARLMGQILIVVEADKTPQSALREALNLVGDCDSVSLLLNKVAQGGLGGAYGYGYGYGYGADYGYGVDEARP